MQAIITLLFFAFLQIVLYNKAKSKTIRHLPFIFVAIGYLICTALWFGAFDSFSDIESNRQLAMILLTIFSRAFVGCLIGIVIFNLLKIKSK